MPGARLFPPSPSIVMKWRSLSWLPPSTRPPPPTSPLPMWPPLKSDGGRKSTSQDMPTTLAIHLTRILKGQKIKKTQNHFTTRKRKFNKDTKYLLRVCYICWDPLLPTPPSSSSTRWPTIYVTFCWEIGSLLTHFTLYVATLSARPWSTLGEPTHEDMKISHGRLE
jgi:hypothetical protein